MAPLPLAGQVRCFVGSGRIARGQAARWIALASAALWAALLVSACTGSTKPIVKLGLIAPFEEAHRADGYAVLHAVRLAVNERNAAGGAGGNLVALVALNDNGRPDEAAMQAAKLAVDRDVLGVVGPLTEATAAAAGPHLQADGLAWLDLAADAAGEAPVPAGFAESYRGLAGSDPTPQAVQAYRAARRILDAIEQASRQGPLARSTVRDALAAGSPES